MGGDYQFSKNCNNCSHKYLDKDSLFKFAVD